MTLANAARSFVAPARSWSDPLPQCSCGRAAEHNLYEQAPLLVAGLKPGEGRIKTYKCLSGSERPVMAVRVCAGFHQGLWCKSLAEAKAWLSGWVVVL